MQLAAAEQKPPDMVVRFLHEGRVFHEDSDLVEMSDFQQFGTVGIIRLITDAAISHSYITGRAPSAGANVELELRVSGEKISVKHLKEAFKSHELQVDVIIGNTQGHSQVDSQVASQQEASQMAPQYMAPQSKMGLQVAPTQGALALRAPLLHLPAPSADSGGTMVSNPSDKGAVALRAQFPHLPAPSADCQTPAEPWDLTDPIRNEGDTH